MTEERKQELRQLLEEAMKILEDGEFPDWNNLMLG